MNLFNLHLGWGIILNTSSHAPLIKSNENASWIPASPDEHLSPLCGEQTHRSSHDKNIAPWIDCLRVQGWASDHSGEWELHGQNDPKNDSDWTVLTRAGNCALLVKHTMPTIIGSADVDSLLEKIWYDSGTQMGQVEEKGELKDCPVDVPVTFWLRNTEGL
ncbi:hypothetical protein F4779DRAFT_639228 [Xylariaceae sp. FL0662B]|nr:hypothetical protein F4779DRAFT_639228 [Xylariaceae sp. FL0662B]